MKSFLISLCFLGFIFGSYHADGFSKKRSVEEPPVKVLVVVTSHDQMGKTGKKTGYYLPEVTHPFYKLKEAGFEVDFVSPKGGKAPMDESSRDLKDTENKRFLEDTKLMTKFESSLKPSEIKAKEYSAILFTGGHGTMWDFPDNKELAKISSSIYENGGVVAAVCHGPAALVNIKLSSGKYLVKGKQVTAFTNQEEEAIKLTKVMPFLLETKLIERGATFTKAEPWKAHVVTSERLVTGQNPASAAGVGEAIVKLLKETPKT